MLSGVPDCLVAATSPHAAAVAYGTIAELVWHDGDDEVVGPWGLLRTA